MRFDLLLAVFSSGLIAPLALMAGGFVLAVGGLVVLLWRRKKLAKPKQRLDKTVDQDGVEVLESSETEASAAPPPKAPPAQEGRRRRSLVGGAERENGTPAGDQANDDTPIEEAEWAEPQEGTDEPQDTAQGEPSTHDTELENTLLEAEHSDLGGDAPVSEAEPEWAEPEPEETADIAADHAQTIAATATGASVAGFAASTDEPADDEIEFAEAPEEEAAEPAQPDTPMPAEVAIARANPIVFRQFMPQSTSADGLSFFGGQPIGPADFQWPRERGAQGGAPLQFVMQWDCSHLSEHDQTGLLPFGGVLYCFINNEHSGDEDFLASHMFVHHRGAATSWGPVRVPDDAGPALGRNSASLLSGCTDAVEGADSAVPRILPRFPFTPAKFAYKGADKDAGILWSDEQATDALLDIQKSGVAVKQSAEESGNVHEELGRPFASFPHDFGAIRVLASRMIETLDQPNNVHADALYSSLSSEELGAQFARWREEAKEIYLLGTQRSAEQRLEQNVADDIWQWFEERCGILGPDITSVFEEAVDLSLGIGSEALSTIPAHWIDKAMHSHALATECENGGESEKGDVLIRAPVRMFGPPSNSPNAIGTRASEDIMLLELPSGAGPQHNFQGRVRQYWIAPDDLAAGKFDQVKMTTT